MGRTNNMWKIDLFYDTNKKDFIKTLTATTLREIAYLFNMEVYDISNFYLITSDHFFLHQILTRDS